MKAWVFWYAKLWFIIWTHLLAILLGIGLNSASIYAYLAARGIIV